MWEPRTFSGLWSLPRSRRSPLQVAFVVGWCPSQFNVLLFGICPQASEGVPMRFFTKLDQLIEFYKKENMGLVTHLQYPVPLEEEDTGDEPEEETGRKGRGKVPWVPAI